jgi:hypothetical protein
MQSTDGFYGQSGQEKAVGNPQSREVNQFRAHGTSLSVDELWLDTSQPAAGKRREPKKDRGRMALRSATLSACPITNEKLRSGLQEPSPATKPLLHVQRSFYRSLSVVSAKSANTSAPIQNLVMTFDSDQPISSKWWCSGAILKMRFLRSL